MYLKSLSDQIQEKPPLIVESLISLAKKDIIRAESLVLIIVIILQFKILNKIVKDNFKALIRDNKGLFKTVSKVSNSYVIYLKTLFI